MVDGGPVPDTAMDTKSDEGEPGELTDTTPLTADERAMLDRLRNAGGGPDVVGEPAEESTTFAAAADDEAPVPGDPPGGSRPDPLEPVFREPDR